MIRFYALNIFYSVIIQLLMPIINIIFIVGMDSAVYKGK
jgi:hypothetical protein